MTASTADLDPFFLYPRDFAVKNRTLRKPNEAEPPKGPRFDTVDHALTTTCLVHAERQVHTYNTRYNARLPGKCTCSYRLLTYTYTRANGEGCSLASAW